MITPDTTSEFGTTVAKDLRTEMQGKVAIAGEASYDGAPVEALDYDFDLSKLERVISGAGNVAALGHELERRGLKRTIVVTGKTLGRSALLEKVTGAAGARCRQGMSTQEIPAQADFRERAKTNDVPIARLIGFEAKGIADGRATVVLAAGPPHANPMGTLMAEFFAISLTPRWV